MALETNNSANQSDNGEVRMRHGRAPGAKDKGKRAGRGEMNERFLKPKGMVNPAPQVHMNSGMPSSLPPIAGAGGGSPAPSLGGQTADEMTNVQGGGLS